jgi:hypothetical protein
MSYDPEKYLESTVHDLKNYVESGFNTRIYQIVMEFPGAYLDASEMPMRKTIVHFEIDDIRDEYTGFGIEPMRADYSEDETTVQGRWAGMHHINFDVGVWASDDSGGTTSRLRAKQILTQLFGYPSSVEALRQFSDGGDGSIEIVQWSGGMNAQDRVNDIRVYRAMNMTLDVRVFSRSPLPTDSSLADTVIEDIVQQPNLTILG